MEPIQEQWVAQFTAYLADRLAEEGAAAGRELTRRTLDLVGHVGTSDRWLVRISLQGDHLVIATLPQDSGPWREHTVRTLADLDACFPEIAAAVSTWASRLTPHALEKGCRYRIARDFTDHYGNEFRAGEELVFDELSFLPYHNGYTLRFVERGMWIQGDSPEYADFGVNVVPV